MSTTRGALRGWSMRILCALTFVACGRTEPVRGLEYTLPPVDAGVPAPALPDGGQIISGRCMGLAQTCPAGFHCESGDCVLNGADSAVQVTLQWQNTPREVVDLDLHLVEPAGRGTCEIYYNSGGLFDCQPVGVLDLDANASCFDTSATSGLAFDTENIIYPSNRSPPVGHYIVRVDYYAECSALNPVPFVVTVRKGDVTTRRTGTFHPGESDSGDLGSGITMMEFDVP